MFILHVVCMYVSVVFFLLFCYINPFKNVANLKYLEMVGL
jgi:hypothetical protein